MSQTPHFAQQVLPTRRRAQLLADAAKLPALVQQIKNDRHSMCIPAQADDYDLLLTRIAALVPLVLAPESELVDACENCAYLQPEDAEEPCPRCGHGIYKAMTNEECHQAAKRYVLS